MAHWRNVSWAPFVVLTAALLFYPKRLTLEYAPIESVRVFDNLPLFGALYYVWIVLVVFLLFSQKPGRSGPYLGLVLVGAFVLVYRGMWDMLLPGWWADGLSNITTVKAIQSAGELPLGSSNITYLEFPGLHILTASLAQVARMELFPSVAVVLILLDMMLACVYYLISVRLLNDARLAAFAALIAMQGNVVFAAYFYYAGFFALVFLGLFTALILRGVERASDRLAATLLLGAATVSHFFTSILFFCFWASVYLLRAVRFRSPESLALSTPILYGVFPIAWLAYWAVQTFGNIVQMGAQLSQNFASDRFLSWLVTGFQANLGGEVPPWAAATKLFWLILLFGLGTLSPLFYLLRGSRPSRMEQTALGALLGVLATSLFSTLLSTRGFEYFRYLIYAPFFTVPFLLKFVKEMPGRLAGYSLGTLVVLFVSLSLPTFFAHHPRVEQYAFYPQEYALGRLLQSSYQKGEPRPRVFGLGFSLAPIVYHVPDAVYVSEGQASIDLVNKQGLWSSVLKMTKAFANEGSKDEANVFVFSTRPQLYYRQNFGIPETDPSWLELAQKLSSHHLVYSNGSVQAYATQGGGVAAK